MNNDARIDDAPQVERLSSHGEQGKFLHRLFAVGAGLTRVLRDYNSNPYSVNEGMVEWLHARQCEILKETAPPGAGYLKFSLLSEVETMFCGHAAIWASALPASAPQDVKAKATSVFHIEVGPDGHWVYSWGTKERVVP